MVEETELWDKQKSVRDLHMDAYNPERGPKPEPEPEPESWLELDEEERIFLTETYHRVARIKLPNMTAHAALHAIVENQIALNLEPVVRAMHRLRKEGLTRHDAVHAIGSVVAEHLFDLKTSKNDDAADSQTRYQRLSAASWGRGEQ
jgi:DNA primase catalytic subunit